MSSSSHRPPPNTAGDAGRSPMPVRASADGRHPYADSDEQWPAATGMRATGTADASDAVASGSTSAGAYMWVVLATALAAQVANSTPNQGVSAIAPFLQADLGMTREQIGLLVSFAQIGMALTFMPGGWAADRFGSRPVAAAGLILVALAPLVIAQARVPLLAYCGTFLAGAGLGLSSPAVTMMILRWFPARARGTAMGIKQSGTPLGGILVAASLPAISQLVGWRAAVAGLVVLILGSMVAVLFCYRDPPGLARPARQAGGGWLTPAALSRPVLVATFYTAVLVAAQFCLVGYTTLFVTEWLGRDAVTAGWVLSAAQAGGMVGRVTWGVVSDQVFHGARKPAMAAAGVLTTLTFGLLAMLSPLAPPAVVLLLAFATGFAVLGWQGVHMALSVELAGPAEAGRVVGFMLTALQIGPIVGPPLIGRLLDVSGSYPLAWAVTAASCGLATLAFVVAMREPARRRR